MPAETVKSAPAKQRSRKRRSKKEKQEQQQREAEKRLALFSSKPDGEDVSKSTRPEGVEVEYVTQEVELTQPEFEVFADVFVRFQKLSSVTDDEDEELPVTTKSTEGQSTEDKSTIATEADESDAENKDEQTLSKKKLKKLNRLTVAELKQLVAKPEVVEVSYLIQ
jgi:splicing factor 3B subunit 2